MMEVQALLKQPNSLTEFKISSTGLNQQGVIDPEFGIQISRNLYTNSFENKTKLSIRSSHISCVNKLTKEYLDLKRKIVIAFARPELDSQAQHYHVVEHSRIASEVEEKRETIVVNI